MTVSWLLEAEMFPHYRDAFIAEVARQGYSLKLLPELKWGYRWEEAGSPYLKLFPNDACVVFHGSMELAIRLSEELPWRPTVYCNWSNYDCSTYYCHLSEFLVNADYVMLPFGELRRRKEFLFDTFARDSAIFVRPNSCRKSFSGQLAHWDSFEADLELMAFYDVPPETIVLVSSPKKIEEEWRFVVAAGEVVAGSLYKSRGQLRPEPRFSPAAHSLATEVAGQAFQPDRTWVFDVCRTAENELHLLEIGSFSFADLYACDLTAVVRAVSRLAIEDWERTG